MQRFTSIFLALCMSILGTGTLQYAHNLTHLRQYLPQEVAASDYDTDPGASAPPPKAPLPHQHSCDLCIQLHLPMAAGHVITHSVCIAPLIGLITIVLRPLVDSLPERRIDCRGPPLC